MDNQALIDAALVEAQRLYAAGVAREDAAMLRRAAKLARDIRAFCKAVDAAAAAPADAAHEARRAIKDAHHHLGRRKSPPWPL